MVGGISVATPSAVVRMSLTVSLLMDKRLFDTNAVTNPHMFGKSFEYTAKKQSSSPQPLCVVCANRATSFTHEPCYRLVRIDVSANRVLLHTSISISVLSERKS